MPITPQDFTQEMSRIASGAKADPERAQSLADDLLGKLLRELGYAAGADIYERMDRTY